MNALPLGLLAVLGVAGVLALLAGAAAAGLTGLFTGQERYWALALGALFACFGWLQLLGAKAGRLRWMAPAGVALCALVAAGSWAAAAWNERIDAVREDVDLRPFAPFANSPRLARLPGPSSLRIPPEAQPTLNGATALYPLYAAVAEATYEPGPRSAHTVQQSRTALAYERLLDGTADIVFAAEPSAKQQAAAAAKGVTLQLTPIGREAFVFFVHRNNPVRNLTREQLAGIYTGATTRWSQVGGRDQAIRAFQRPDGSGSQTQLMRLLAGKAPAPAPQVETVRGMGEVVRRAADYRNHGNAIGFSFRWFASELVADERIRLLAIDGVAPTEASVADSSYPLAAPFYAVTIAGRETAATRQLRDWLVEPQGQELVRRSGYVGRP